MMNDKEKSDLGMVAVKPTNKGTPVPAESVEPRAGARGESGKPKHAPDTGPGKRVTSGQPDTAITSEGV